uniref:Uncharacterized protein n=1 Tax=Ursus maritimus TaxID=29073 RepID=A0A452TFE9_URSMA
MKENHLCRGKTESSLKTHACVRARTHTHTHTHIYLCTCGGKSKKVIFLTIDLIPSLKPSL